MDIKTLMVAKCYKRYNYDSFKALAIKKGISKSRICKSNAFLQIGVLCDSFKFFTRLLQVYFSPVMVLLDIF